MHTTLSLFKYPNHTHTMSVQEREHTHRERERNQHRNIAYSARKKSRFKQPRWPAKIAED
ncbi:UNVERIFIED_CONTAM: hypothetical protein FKN15_020275 [Acipenser sinensis]